MIRVFILKLIQRALGNNLILSGDSNFFIVMNSELIVFRESIVHTGDVKLIYCLTNNGL